MKPYDFAILRYMHNIASGEFVNIAVVMWLPDESRFIYRITTKHGRVSHFFYPFNSNAYTLNCKLIKNRFDQGLKELVSGKQGHLFNKYPKSIEQVIYSLVAHDASAFQWSEIKSGISNNPEKRLEQLFVEFISRHEVAGRTRKEHRDDTKVFSTIKNQLKATGLYHKVEPDVVIKSPYFSYTFKLGWHNGERQVIEPISFDYQSSNDIIDKAVNWSGRLVNLERDNDTNFEMTGVIASPNLSDSKLKSAYKDATKIIKNSPCIRTLITEEDFSSFIPKIEEDIEHSLKNKSN